MTNIKRLALVALAGFGLSAFGAVQDTEWWNVDFESPTSNGVSFVWGQLGSLTNSIAYSGTAGDQPYDAGVWYAIDGDESYITNGIVTNVVGSVKTEKTSDYLKLDTQGNDLKWAPVDQSAAVSNKITLVDADLYLVGSDSPPDPTDFDGNNDVQTAVYLRNYVDEDSGETTNSLLCVYVRDADSGNNYWQELSDVGIEDNSWHHIRVLVDYSVASGFPQVQVFVDDMDTPVSANGEETKMKWAIANASQKDFKALSSVSFRGTGAIDNFVGSTREESFETLWFAAEVYIDGVKQAEGATGNTTRYVQAEAGDAGSGKTVTFEGFLYHDFDLEVLEPPTYCLRSIELVNFVDNATETLDYGYTGVNDGMQPIIETETNAVRFITMEDPESGEDIFYGPFNVTALTDGATDDTNIVAKIYLQTIGAFNAFAETTIDGTTTTNAYALKPADMPVTTNWTFAATSGANILSTIRVYNGAGLVYEDGVATVSVAIADGDFDADTIFASATYVEGSLADGQELRYTEAGGVYTFAPYTPPVAIIVAGNVTNEYPSLRAAIDVALPGSTIYLVADDKVSFTAEDPEVVINKALTIDGGSNTLYGVTDYAYDGVNDHDIYIGGSGNVTIKNLTLSEFSDTVPTAQRRTNPIWVGKGYTGTLMLDGVTVTNFNRTAFNLGGGTVVVTNCVVGGCYDPEMEGDDCFQSAIEVFDANVTVAETKVTGVGSTMTKEDSQIASCFTLISDIASDPWTGGTGSIRILSGSYAGEYIGLAMDRSEGSILVEGGTFVAAAPAADEAFGLDGEDPASSITITGGWFDRPPTNYLADGFTAVNYGTDAPDRSAPWTVVLGNAIWIGGAQGDWEDAANWDVGLVPTKDTVATFTNDAEVVILSESDACKEMVLRNANVTLVRDANATKPTLHIYGNAGRAVSVDTGATGSLGVNNLALFTECPDGDLTIDCDLQVLGSVTFRGLSIVSSQLSSSFVITGKTTVSATAVLKTIDYGTTKFQGGVEVAKGVTAKFTTNPNGGVQIGTGVTLVANDGEGNPTEIWLMSAFRGVSLASGATIAVDADHAATFYEKKMGNGSGIVDGYNCDVHRALPKRTVIDVTADEGLTVEGIATGDRFVPGTNFVIAVTGFGEGYEPSVMITNAANDTVLLTTNVASFVYTAPDFDIGVIATKVLKTFDVIWVVEGSDPVTNKVDYNELPTYSGTPTKPSTAEFDYEFAGWDPEVVAATGDATYTAKFTEILRSYAVKFWTNEVDVGEAWFSTNAPYGTLAAAYAPTNDPTRAATTTTNFTFAGWTNAVAGGETVATADLPAVAGEASWLAVWTETPIWTVTFKNGDDTIYETNYLDGATAEYVGETPTKDSTAQYAYTFAGWDPALGAVTADTVYAATFSSNLVSYTITFSTNGVVYATTNALYGATDYGPAADPAWEGHAFNGWTNAVAGGAVVATADLPAVTGAAEWAAVFTEEEDISVNAGDGLAQYKVDHPEAKVPEPIEFTAAATPLCEVSFVAPRAATYVLLSSESLTGQFSPDGTPVEAAAGQIVTLTEGSTSQSGVKFFKIGRVTPEP